MTSQELLNFRLQNQNLSQTRFKSSHEAVKYFGGTQSQDYPAALWSLGQRIPGTTFESLEKDYNEGKFLRTHMMRPTWHFVTPEDLRWIEELTSGRVKTLLGHYNRKLELTDDIFARTNKLLTKALEGKNYKTRQELKAVLANAGIKTDVQRLAHIIMWAELDGLVCSGPKIGKQFSYALTNERAPKTKDIKREEALAELALRYFTSHGPAQMRDLMWWSGLTSKDCQLALETIKAKLASDTSDNKTYWRLKNSKLTKNAPNKAYLLSIYDEYTIAYKDRSGLGGGMTAEKLLALGNALTAVMVFNGQLVGTWKRRLKKDTVEVVLSPFKSLSTIERESFEKEVTQLGKFLELNASYTVK